MREDTIEICHLKKAYGEHANAISGSIIQNSAA